jgi:hypothetical protein
MAFVARFHFPAAAPGQLVWSTFYGAPGNQSADDVVVDSTGAAIIVGGTAANNPPTTERAFDRIPGAGYGVGFPEGKADGYVARISADGGRVLYCTLLGGSYSDTVSHVAYAGGTSVVVAGLTNSPDLPVTAGAFDTIYASDGKPSGNATPGTLAADVFVARLTLEAPVTGDITPPPAPDLLGPPVGATFDYPGRNLTLDWSDVADPSGVAAYHLQFSPNAGFVNDFNAELNGWFEPWLPTSVAVFTAGHSGTFFWRVQALDRAGNLGPWSAVRSLTVASSTPAAPNLVSPPDAGQFAPGTVAFAWAAAAGAKTYELEVDTTSTFTGAGKIFVSGITQLQQSLSLMAESTYWWHVRGVSEVTVGPWSTVRSFRIKRGSPPAPPPPPSTAPPPGPATALAGLTLGADVVFGAGTVSGTVTLNGAAPAGGATVALASNYPSRAAVPASVTVPAGSTSATFSVTTAASTQFAQVMISGEYGGVTQGGVLQAYASDPVVDLDNFTVSTTTLLGGDTVQGTVAILFTFTAGSGGALVTLGSTNPALASVPASVTIPPGTNTASFLITTQPVTTATTVTILASRSRTIGVALELLPPGALSSLSLNPTTVTGGQSSQGTVTLASPAPAGGVVVALSSSNTAVATVPTSVSVPAGAASATFTVSTNPVFGSGTWSTITASAGGISRSAILNVNPGAPPPATATLSSVAVSPTSVAGGTSAQGTVTLTSAAPAGGFAVALSSNNAAATVPASVTVAANATSATFTVPTTSVTTSTVATITASAGGVTRTAALTVTPPPPPAQTATLTVTASGRSGETVTSSPAGINVAVGSTGSASFATGTAITLSVSNGRDAVWSGACSSGGNKAKSCTLTLTGTATVTANVQ